MGERSPCRYTCGRHRVTPAWPGPARLGSPRVPPSPSPASRSGGCGPGQAAAAGTAPGAAGRHRPARPPWRSHTARNRSPPAAGPRGRGFAAHSPGRPPGRYARPRGGGSGRRDSPAQRPSSRVGPAGLAAPTSPVSPKEASPRAAAAEALGRSGRGVRAQRCHSCRSFALGHEVSQCSDVVRVLLGKLVGRRREGGLARTARQPRRRGSLIVASPGSA